MKQRECEIKKDGCLDMSVLQLHHVSIMVDDLDWYVNFFGNVYGMTVIRTKGEAPKRNVWFAEGVQLRETTELPKDIGLYDHLSFAAEDIPTVVATALAQGCTAVEGKGAHWFRLPNGALVEMKPPRA